MRLLCIFPCEMLIMKNCYLLEAIWFLLCKVAIENLLASMLKH